MKTGTIEYFVSVLRENQRQVRELGEQMEKIQEAQGPIVDKIGEMVFGVPVGARGTITNSNGTNEVTLRNYLLVPPNKIMPELALLRSRIARYIFSGHSATFGDVTISYADVSREIPGMGG